MDAVRFGLSLRALRRRRGWTQAQLGQRARTSDSTISRLERGQAPGFTVRVLDRVLESLGARMLVRVLWQGEDLDRLLDAGHARLVEAVVRLLVEAGWEVIPEATFRVGGERGSIDVLAWHPTARVLLVVEVKSVVPDVQATLAGVDRKARLAPTLASERGWAVDHVARLLVLPDDRTARRRVAAFASTFERAFPARTSAIRRWIRRPIGAIAGVLFLTDLRAAGPRHRVRPPRTQGPHGRPPMT